jgi:hypothetical protein
MMKQMMQMMKQETQKTLHDNGIGRTMIDEGKPTIIIVHHMGNEESTDFLIARK